MSIRRTRALGFLLASLAVVGGAPRLPAQTPSQIVVALMTGFNPGANPGMTQLNAKLQAAFGPGSGAPPFSSQVFTYTSTAAASAYIAGFGPSATVVLIGHSLGAEANFALAQNLLGPQGLNVDLQISFDYVALASPFAPTVPTVPPQILRAQHFRQISTAFLEPVSSVNINGLERNLNMEVVFNDPSIVHTSIDCDDRCHQLAIERIRELYQPPAYPGTNERLDLFCRLDTLNVPCVPASGIAAAGVLTQRGVQNVAGGQWVTLRTIAPEGDFNGQLFGVLGEFFVAGAPPVSVAPGIASSLNPATILLFTPGLVQPFPFAFATLGATGADFQACWPVGFTGASLLLQTVVVATSADNGLYASSLGVELRGI